MIRLGPVAGNLILFGFGRLKFGYNFRKICKFLDKIEKII